MSVTKKLLLCLSIVVLIGLGAGGAMLLASKSKSSEHIVNKPVNATNATTPSSQYKLSACTSGTTQTIAIASYLIGTDLAPGNYKVVSQPAGIDWTNINVYNTKGAWIKQGSPSLEQGNADTSLAPDNNVPTYIKLTDGQFMQVDADPAIFSCQ